MKLDYQPARAGDDGRVRGRVLRLAATGLLLVGLFFGLAETVVFVLRVLAAGPFSDSRREPLAARVEEAIPILLIAVGGYAVAAVGYLLDRRQRA